MKQKVAKRKLREEAHTAHKKAGLEEAVQTDPAAEAAIQWLEQNILPWSTALDKWELSFPIRKQQLQNKKFTNELYFKYQLYQEQYGYQAVS